MGIGVGKRGRGIVQISKHFGKLNCCCALAKNRIIEKQNGNWRTVHSALKAMGNIMEGRGRERWRRAGANHYAGGVRHYRFALISALRFACCLPASQEARPKRANECSGSEREERATLSSPAPYAPAL